MAQLVEKATAVGEPPVAAAAGLLRALKVDATAWDLIAEAPATLRTAAATLRERSRDHTLAGRPGLAWVTAVQAQELDPTSATGRDLVEETAKALSAAARPAVTVLPVIDSEMGHSWAERAGEQARVALRTQAREDSLAHIVNPAEWSNLASPGSWPAGRFSVSIRLGRFWVDHDPDVVETRRAVYTEFVPPCDDEPPGSPWQVEVHSFEYPVVHRSASGHADLTLGIRVAGEARLASSVPLSVDPSYRDTVIRGCAKAGVEADPPELPSDDHIRHELQKALLARLRDAIETEFLWFGRDAYEAADRARVAGDLVTAADRAVVAWRARSDSGLPFAVTDLDFIERETGWSPRNGQLSPRHLR